MQIRPLEAELFHADGRTDMKFIIDFRNLPKAPKKKVNSESFKMYHLTK